MRSDKDKLEETKKVESALKEIDKLFADYQNHLENTTKDVIKDVLLTMLNNLEKIAKKNGAVYDVKHIKVMRDDLTGKNLSRAQKAHRDGESLEDAIKHFSEITHGITKLQISDVKDMKLSELQKNLKDFLVFEPSDLTKKRGAVSEIRSVLNSKEDPRQKLKEVRTLVERDKSILEKHRGKGMFALIVKAINFVLKALHDKPIFVTGAKVTGKASGLFAREEKRRLNTGIISAEELRDLQTRHSRRNGK